MNHELNRIASVQPSQWLYLFGDKGVVYSESQNRFAGLDASATAAYLAFESGATLRDLGAFAAEHNSRSASEDGLSTILALARGVFPPEESCVRWPIVDRSQPLISESHNLTEVTIEVGSTPVLFKYPPGRLEELCDDVFRNCSTTTRFPFRHISVLSRGDAWGIYGNGIELLASLRDGQLGLGLLHAARALLYAEAEYDLAFHASMVSDGEHGIMLSAPRECGKSTLAAHLVARDFSLVTDEPALLCLDSGFVASLRMPISLKEGSWALFQNDWPQLINSPVHLRSDGTKIRLLHPPPAGLSAASECLTHIVFPRFSATSAPSVERLSPWHTLCLLNEGGLTLGKHLTLKGFEAFLRWVTVTPAYAFRYGSVQEANHMIREMITETKPSNAQRPTDFRMRYINSN